MNRIKKFLLRALWQDPNYEIDQVNCPEFLFDGVDQAVYDKLLAEGDSFGITFGSEVTYKGCTFDWNYDAPTSTLHVTCTKRPVYVGCGYIQSQLQKLIDAARVGI